MRFHTEYLTFRTAKHREYINITAQVESAVRKSGIQEGMVLVSAMHITAGVYVNDAEDGLIADIDDHFGRTIPIPVFFGEGTIRALATVLDGGVS
jgi:thiamine phosphate synthase YjbQ (UPF0047 family)